MAELLALADDECLQMWNSLRLSYTETQGLPALRRAVAERLYSSVAPDQLAVAAPQELVFLCMQARGGAACCLRGRCTRRLCRAPGEGGGACSPAELLRHAAPRMLGRGSSACRCVWVSACTIVPVGCEHGLAHECAAPTPAAPVAPLLNSSVPLPAPAGSAGARGPRGVHLPRLPVALRVRAVHWLRGVALVPRQVRRRWHGPSARRLPQLASPQHPLPTGSTRSVARPGAASSPRRPS